MKITRSIPRGSYRLAMILVAVIMSGCAASSSGVYEKMDSQTGVTVTSSSAPLVMYRDEPGRAAYARNFLHVGPIQVNRSGSYHYFLWVGIWNTMQAASPSEIHDGFDSILLFVDGEPLLLDVSGWTPAAIGVSEPVYVKPVASAVDAYYRVTADQIRLIAESDELRLRTTGTWPREFQLWTRQEAARSSLQSFLDRQ